MSLLISVTAGVLYSGLATNQKHRLRRRRDRKTPELFVSYIWATRSLSNDKQLFSGQGRRLLKTILTMLYVGPDPRE